MTLTLVLGNQRFSSWSLRPWLCLAQSGLAFETVVLRFDDPDFKAKVPGGAGKVPVLVQGDLVVHESLAICEHIAEVAADAGLWPADRALRAQARALACEMHAGFAALRSECSMDVCRTEAPGAWPLSAAARTDVARIDAIFRQRHAPAEGPFLFGRFGVVDAMFAPVASRVLSYALDVSPEARVYVDTLRALPAMDAWYRAGEKERELGWRHDASASRAPRDREDATAFALRWAEAWNRRDLAAVLALFADDAVFVSPRARDVTGHARVDGKAALTAYWTQAAARLPPSLRFQIERVDRDGETGSLTMRYLRLGPSPSRALEILDFDPRTGLVTRGEAYEGSPLDASP